MSRLFIGHLIKYTVTPIEFERLKHVYVVTTDVDLFPLSTKIYSDYSHDFAIINPLNIDKDHNKLYIALSCIGGSLGVWDRVFRNAKHSAKFDRHFFNFSKINVSESVRL